MKPDCMAAVQKWAQDFEYVADEGDHWTIPSMDNPKGDCEDLALGAAYIIAGKFIPRMLWMFLARQVELFTGNSLYSGERHAALRYGKLWIDTGHRYWSSSPRLDGARRVSVWRILRELGYVRHMRIAAAVLLLISAVLFAQASRAQDTVPEGDRGTVFLFPAPPKAGS